MPTVWTSSDALSYVSALSIRGMQGKHESADLLHQRAIRIREKALGPDNLGLVFYLNNRAIALERQASNIRSIRQNLWQSSAFNLECR